MADKKITKITKEEVNKAIAEFSVPKQQPIQSKKLGVQNYIEKLKDKDIIDYFSQFGLIDFEKVSLAKNDPFRALRVDCKDFMIVLSDFDIIINFRPTSNPNITNSEFNINDFYRYCIAIDTPPDKALADLIQLEFLGQRFHSYESNFSKHKQTKRKEAFEKLPKGMKKTLKLIDEKRENEIIASRNKLQYGDFGGDPQTKS